jgi:hypothetical protein
MIKEEACRPGADGSRIPTAIGGAPPPMPVEWVRCNCRGLVLEEL